MGRRALVAIGILGAALCFSLGWLASRAVEAPQREQAATPSSEPKKSSDASVGTKTVAGDPKPPSFNLGDAGPDDEPLLLIDPSKVTLLPDASLNLEAPSPPDVP